MNAPGDSPGLLPRSGDVKPSGLGTAVFRSRTRFALTFRRLREFRPRQLYASRSSRRKRILPSNFAQFSRVEVQFEILRRFNKGDDYLSNYLTNRREKKRKRYAKCTIIILTIGREKEKSWCSDRTGRGRFLEARARVAV